MRRRIGKKFAVVSVIISMVFSGCAGWQEKSDCPYEEFIVVDVFDSPANYQGIQSGWFAKIVKDKFNMELNIIAPNVAGGGDTLYEIRSAAGDLGDLIILDAGNGKLQDAVTAGILMDMSQLLSGKEIMQYETAIRALNEEIGQENCIYAIPSSVSNNTPLTPSESLELSYGTYVRWDLYERLGYPKMETLEDLLPVLKQMQELEPYSESGEMTYAFSFFKDWDDNLMNAAKQPACLYGYDESGFVLARADGTDYQSIIDKDSLYVRSLKFFFEANQLGLVDPESPIQNYETVFEKYTDGQILFSIWPWLGQSAYNTLDHKEQGKGFMLAPVEDMQIYSYGCDPEGNKKSVIGIGSNAQDPERLADFIDWLYSPEGIMINGAQMSGGTAGPEGLTWEMTTDGPKLTEFGIQALLNGNAVVPDEWGGGIWSEGGSALNYKPVAQCEISPDGYAYAFELWDSVREMESTVLDKAWQNYMQAESTMDYLTQHDMIVVAAGHPGSIDTESTDITTMRSQCKNVIVDYSWQMIFAADEETFYELLEEMQTKAVSLGYNTVYKLDLNRAKRQYKERQKAVEKYSE